MPERPVEIRVWYLRGALDDDVGFIPALKAPRTKRKKTLRNMSKLNRQTFEHVLRSRSTKR